MKPAHHGQLMLSIGALLAAEREKRGIPVEKAAKETRMRPQRLRDMENDDLSHFTNPSYARMFIIAYAKYLGVSMQTISDHLPDRGESGTEGYQYISTSTDNLPSLRQDIASKPVRRNAALYILAASALLLVLTAVAGITYLVVMAPRLQTDPHKSKPIAEATPPPQKVIVQEIIAEKTVTLDNLQPGADKSNAFSEEMAFAKPPATVAPRAPMLPAEIPLTVTTGPSPTPAPAPEDDHAFLLGATPDQRPAPMQ